MPDSNRAPNIDSWPKFGITEQGVRHNPDQEDGLVKVGVTTFLVLTEMFYSLVCEKRNKS